MGYWYMYGESDTGFQQALAMVSEKLSEVQPREDGSFDVNITIDGATQQSISFKAGNLEELKEMVAMNAGKLT